MVIMRKRLLQIPNFKKFKWYLRLHLDIGMNKKKCKEHLYFCSTLNIFSALNNYRLFLAKINIVFLSIFFRILHSWSEFCMFEPGGLYTSIIFSGVPFVSILKLLNWLNSLLLNLSYGKIFSPVFAYTKSPPPTPFVVSARSFLISVSST